MPRKTTIIKENVDSENTIISQDNINTGKSPRLINEGGLDVSKIQQNPNDFSFESNINIIFKGNNWYCSHCANRSIKYI